MERHNSLLYHRIALVAKPKAYFLHLMNVPGRDLILHPANGAKKEMLGCLATLTNTQKLERAVIPEKYWKS